MEELTGDTVSTTISKPRELWTECKNMNNHERSLGTVSAIKLRADVSELEAKNRERKRQSEKMRRLRRSEREQWVRLN